MVEDQVDREGKEDGDQNDADNGKDRNLQGSLFKGIDQEGEGDQANADPDRPEHQGGGEKDHHAQQNAKIIDREALPEEHKEKGKIDQGTSRIRLRQDQQGRQEDDDQGIELVLRIADIRLYVR